MQRARVLSECASKLRALANPTRIHVIDALMDRPRHVSELMSIVGVPQSLLSHHLRVMRKAGLVRSVRDGKARRYELASGEQRTPVVDLGCCQIHFGPKRRGT